jgi:hypothetical protein
MIFRNVTGQSSDVQKIQPVNFNLTRELFCEIEDIKYITSRRSCSERSISVRRLELFNRTIHNSLMLIRAQNQTHDSYSSTKTKSGSFASKHDCFIIVSSQTLKM